MPLDATGIPSNACPVCGHMFFQIIAHFSEYEIDFYTLEGTCDDCGALVTVPCLVDDPQYVA